MKRPRSLPLNALQTFEAAARHLSFTRAGQELGLTQTAVSYQIKQLEDRLGEALFLRKPRQVALTETGQRLLPRVSEAFSILDEALASMRAGDDILNLYTTPTFAQQWLASRLGAFQLGHPTIAVRLTTIPVNFDFAREPADLAIRWGTGQWPGLAAHLLMRLDFSPVLSPKLAAESHLKTPADLLKLPIVSPGDTWWKVWFSAAGVDASAELERRPPNDFGLQALDAGAAKAGAGVAIVSPRHYAEDIASGRLVQPFPLTANDGRDYWLTYPESRRNVPKIRAFRDWILAALATDGTASTM